MQKPNILVNQPGPITKPWIERIKASMSAPPLWFGTVFSKGDGIYIKDLDGNLYIGLTTLARNLGFRHPEVVAAAKEQLDITGVGNPPGVHQRLVQLSEKLKEIAPHPLSTGRVAFCNTGSDATEAAMMLVRAYTGKQLILGHLGGHHGVSSMGALSITTDRSNSRRFCLPLIPGIVHVPYPHCYRCSYGQEYPSCDFSCIEHVRYTFDTAAHPDETAAFFIEAIQSQEVAVPPKEYFSELKKICSEKNVLLVDDEVIIGFGRTGKMWGIDHWGIEPDITYMAKVIGNGIPLAAVIGKSEIMEVNDQHHIIRGGAFGGNPVSCACTLTHIEVIQRDKLVKNAADIGDYMLKRLQELKESHELIGDVRGKGLFIGIELVKDPESKKPATEEARRFMTEAFHRGVLIQATGIYRHVIRLAPPLIITKEEAEMAIIILEEALKKVEDHSK